MVRNNHTPKFPDSYKGEKAKEYDREHWMERNQKRTTLKCIQYLYDPNLGNTNLDRNSPRLVLDLGSGTGFSSEVLIEHGFRVIGIEILEDMLSLARKKYSTIDSKEVSFILSDINNLPLREQSINHAISISAYNFIIHSARTEREKKMILTNTAKQIGNILKKDARFIIEFYPNDDTELDAFSKSFRNNDFEGFIIKEKENQRSGKTFLLLKKR